MISVDDSRWRGTATRSGVVEGVSQEAICSLMLEGRCPLVYLSIR